jgi:hypothetical protein
LEKRIHWLQGVAGSCLSAAADCGAAAGSGLSGGQGASRDRGAVPVFPEMESTWVGFAGVLPRQPTKLRLSMKSQVRFVMHPDDEREFEQLLLADESIRFIEGPRWKTETPLTSRSLADIHDNYRIIWSPNDIAKRPGRSHSDG